MRTAGLAIVVVALACAVSAQEQNRVDVSISGAGVFPKTATAANTDVSNKPTKSVEFLGSVRYHFRAKHALDVNFGRTKDSQIFAVPPNTFRVLTSITEFTGAYVFSPHVIRNFQPFVFAGGGALHFGPGNTFVGTFPTATLGARAQTSLAFAYGGGVDRHLWRMLSARVQYRGLLYKAPDFGLPGLFFTGAHGHMVEPTAGIVAKF